MKNEKNTLPLSDAEIDEAAAGFGAALHNQEKVRIKIPIDPLNPTDSFVPVCINGYVYQINRGKTVEVPQSVADILEDAKYL